LKDFKEIKLSSSHYQRTFSTPDKPTPLYKICATRTWHQSGMDAPVRFYKGEWVYLVKAEYGLRSAVLNVKDCGVPTRFPHARERSVITSTTFFKTR
jgi:hypothetical protein